MSSPSSCPCPRCGDPVTSDETHCGACGQHIVSRDEPPESWIGRTLEGKYEIESVLGVGGMGMVFKARRVLIGDSVALKILFPRFLESPLQRRLFQDEAVAVARLSHPNVVTVFDAEFTPSDGSAFIAMELLKGETYKAVLRARAPLAPAALLPTMADVCSGLAAAHEARIIHRDLKPDNIFLEHRRDGRVRVKLVDFGIAAMLDADHRDEQRRLLGTLRYMAPEQCRGEPIDGRADLYALGVVIYESLTRRRATGKTISAVINDDVKPPNVILPVDRHIPHPLEDLVMRLLSKSPADRPADALTVREELLAIQERLTGGDPALAPPLTSTPPAPGTAPSMGPGPVTYDFTPSPSRSPRAPASGPVGSGPVGSGPVGSGPSGSGPIAPAPIATSPTTSSSPDAAERDGAPSSSPVETAHPGQAPDLAPTHPAPPGSGGRQLLWIGLLFAGVVGVLGGVIFGLFDA